MLVLIILVLAGRANSHQCKVIKKQLQRNEGRYLEETIEREEDWQPIRFHVDWSGLAASDKSLYEKYIDAAFVYYSNSLKVHRIKSAMVWDEFLYDDSGYCSELLNRFKDRIIEETDMIIYIVSEDDSSEDYVGYSVGCGNDPVTYQPIASLININKAYIDTSSNSEDQIIMLMIHELAHSLGFSNEDFYNFKKPNGDFYVSEELFTVTTKRGIDVVYLSTPKVKEYARAAYGCNNLPGIELENQGGDGSALQHWEKRMVGPEIMNPQMVLSDAVYSYLTLAAFEDSGWYKPDYSYSTQINFGYQKGCEFIDLKCIVNEQPISEEFCVKTDRMYCDSSHLSYGYCYLKEYSSIDNEFQYFSDKNQGGDPFSDYCPINKKTYDCRSDFVANDDYGEEFCLNCRCFESTITKSQSTSTIHPSCYKVNCLTNSYQVTIGTVTLTCSIAGQELVFEGFSGKLICPEFKKLCYQVPCKNNCYGGKCENGICLNGGDYDYFSGESYPDGKEFDCDGTCGDSSSSYDSSSESILYESDFQVYDVSCLLCYTFSLLLLIS